ncbi:hypothetical protein YPPY14_2950, partial [Yersinia pestis PY-14]
MDSDNL